MKFLKDLDIEKVRLEEEKKIESLKDPSRSKDLSRLRELRQKIESITACFDRKESCLKKINIEFYLILKFYTFYDRFLKLLV